MLHRALLVVATLASFTGCHYPARTEPSLTTTSTPSATTPAPTKNDGAPTKKAFDDIYKNATWGKNEAGAGNSGTGSTMKATGPYRVMLQQFLADNNIHSVVDAGCGDWEFSKSIDWTGVDYKGVDIVDDVIAKDKKLYEAPNIHFSVGNIVEDDLPPADLLISKHVLQHLPIADVQKFLDKQLKKYKHVLLTNGVDSETMSATNAVDIAPGQYRELDVTKPPFNVKGRKILMWYDDHHMHQVVHITP